ncbi:hypothetical protein RDG65_002505 [Vibrio fluvialis]|nr:hypothetical protein [Vibrio fluvialis]
MKLAFVVTLCLFTSLAVWSGYQQVKVIRRVEVTKYEKKAPERHSLTGVQSRQLHRALMATQ